MPTSDAQTEIEAANQQLLDHPKSIAAHIQAADLHMAAGKDAVALHHYRTALRIAEWQEAPEISAEELQRAQAILNDKDRELYANREKILLDRGFERETWSPRLSQSLELAGGERTIFRSHPTEFEFAGLPTVQFYDPAQFAWAADVEAATPQILAELEQELKLGIGDFRPYVGDYSEVPEANATLLGKKDWSVLPISERGWVSTEMTRRFPKTWEAIRQAPLPGIYGWGPTVVFSLLKAGTRIPAHNGMYNIRLICHLPLIVPPGCRFRVGNEIREWEVGKLMIFDDTIEHEAWNDSDEDRVVLIFDIWRPELTEEERAQLLALFHI